jgi:hypothetical protein
MNSSRVSSKSQQPNVPSMSGRGRVISALLNLLSNAPCLAGHSWRQTLLLPLSIFFVSPPTSQSRQWMWSLQVCLIDVHRLNVTLSAYLRYCSATITCCIRPYLERAKCMSAGYARVRGEAPCGSLEEHTFGESAGDMSYGRWKCRGRVFKIASTLVSSVTGYKAQMKIREKRKEST